MDISKEEFEKLKEIAELYQVIKPIIIYSEEIDSYSNSNLQVIKELRDAFDHIIRVITIKTGVKSNNKSDYTMLNIEKSIGHVYRAGFDALDGLVISLKEDILEMLKRYKSDIIVSIIPNYWKYRQEINQISITTAECRQNKDSGNDLKVLLSDYLKNAENLKNIHNVFINAMPLIEEKNKEVNKTKLISNIIKFLGWFIAIILAFLSIKQ
jgi:hypothetical protein